MMSEEELVPIDDPDIPNDCGIYEVFVDGRSVGFVVIGPDGKKYRAASRKQALEIAASITQQTPKPGF